MSWPRPSRTSLGASALWLLCGKAVAFLLSLALPLVLVRLLSLQDFGVYKQVFLVVGTAVTLLPLGFATTAYYFLSRSPQRGPAVALNILLFHAAVAGLAWGVLTFAPGLLGLAFRQPEIGALSPLIAWVVLFSIVAAVLEPIAVGNQEARAAATFIAGVQAARTLLALVAVLLLGGIRALLYAAIAHGAVNLALLAGYLWRRFGPFWRAFDGPLLRAQLGYALPHGFAALLSGLQSDLHLYLVAGRYDAAVYAVYAIGCFQLPLVGILNESVSSVLIPRVSRLQLEGRPHQILALTVRMVTRLGVAILPLYAFLVVWGREFLEVVFTARYLASWPVFAVNLTLLPLSLLATACDPVIRGYAEERYFLVRLRVALGLGLVAALWTLVADSRGPVLAITIVVAVQAMERLAIAFRVGRILEVGRRDLHLLGDLGKVAFAAAAAAGASALLKGAPSPHAPLVTLGLGAGVFASAYLGLLRFLGLLDLARGARRGAEPLVPRAEIAGAGPRS